MSAGVRRWWGPLLVVTLLLVGAWGVSGDPTTHGLPDQGRQRQQALGDLHTAFALSGCLPSVPGSGLTLGSFACEAYVKDTTTGELVYTREPGSTLGPVSGTSPSWVLVRADTSTVPAGWTCKAGSRYCHRQASSQPTTPTKASLIARLTVAAGNITAVADFRLPSSYARTRMFEVTDGLYGATGNGTTDDTTALQAALTAARDQGGRTVLLPEGTYRTTSALTIYANTTLQGRGRLLSLIKADHVGNGLVSTSSTGGVTTAMHITLKDFGLDKLGLANEGTGGGYVDVYGAFLRLDNVFIRTFAYQVILDGSEHVAIHGSEFIIKNHVGIWFVNGADRTAGAEPFFTNLVSVTDNQFNAFVGTTGKHILDDGGSQHIFKHNNFVLGAYAIYASNTWNLRVENNFIEGQSTEAITLAAVTLATSYLYAKNLNPVITSNAFSVGSGTYNISVSSALGGEITNNQFMANSSSVAHIRLQDDNVAGVLIAGNTKLQPPIVTTEVPFIAATAARLAAQRYKQRLFTSSAAGAAAGAGVVITPRQVGFPGTLEQVRVGERVLITDPNTLTPTALGNREHATVTAASATTLTLTLANSYAADFNIIGLDDTSVEESTQNTSNQGTGTIPNGATSVTITHGQNYTLHTIAAPDIAITRTSTSTNLVSAVWVSTLTPTTFVVNCNTDPGASGLTFAWKVALPYRR